MKFNWFYAFVIVVLGTMLFVTVKYFRGSANSSIGVTQAREYKVNAERPAVVKSINVHPGQQVKHGDLLLELSSSALEVDITKHENRLAALKSDQIAKRKLADSRIAFVKAEQGVLVDKLNSEIQQTESELKLNQRLSKKYIAGSDSVAADNPVNVRLKALKQQRQKQEEAISIKVKDILQEKETEESLLVNQIDVLQRELVLLQDERKTLIKFASADGIVETVYVRQGEQVDAYTSLLSIHPLSPTTVVGYLMGSKPDLEVGSLVTVKSYGAEQSAAEGEVIGYGAVVELPEILQKSTAVKAFGREVFIEIPPDNQFATGEKVLIR
jgi:multidrug resistance efflux pump